MKNVSLNSLKLMVCITSICYCFQVTATVRTVNNSTSLPVNPGQYTTISAAITAASAGDTILVTGNVASYGENLNISKKLTLIGTGYDPQYQPSTVLNGYVQFNTGSNGSAIMGFDITCAVWFSSSSLRNILVYRNYIAGDR